MKEQIQNDYRTWLLNLTCGWCSDHGEYMQLMQYLYSQPFYSIYPNDRNRAADGVEMRFRFVDNREDLTYTYRDIYNYMMSDGCNMLEMMAALAIRCEDHIMGDPEIGDRSGVWFWGMIRNMHLDDMTDQNFDILKVDKIVVGVLERKYKKNGDGGLFKVHDKNVDMRYAEIWYQMNWYLGEQVNMLRG